MLYMNEWDIATAWLRAERSQNAVLIRATKFLAQFQEEVNAHSDGWPYWSAPVKAAAKLMTLVQNSEMPTETDLRKALTPIKSFYTRRGNAAGMKFPEVQ
jgi:hypothetical protein